MLKQLKHDQFQQKKLKYYHFAMWKVCLNQVLILDSNHILEGINYNNFSSGVFHTSQAPHKVSDPTTKIPFCCHWWTDYNFYLLLKLKLSVVDIIQLVSCRFVLFRTTAAEISSAYWWFWSHNCFTLPPISSY